MTATMAGSAILATPFIPAGIASWRKFVKLHRTWPSESRAFELCPGSDRCETAA